MSDTNNNNTNATVSTDNVNLRDLISSVRANSNSASIQKVFGQGNNTNTNTESESATTNTTDSTTPVSTSTSVSTDKVWRSSKNSKLPHKIEINFSTEITLNSLEFCFQGGFAALSFSLFALSSSGRYELLNSYEAGDHNENQTFTVPNINNLNQAKSFRVLINKSTDTYGRVIIYTANLYGKAK